MTYGIIIDNVAFHKVKPAIELIEKTGARIFYLPHYSPYFSFIEMMWSKIKSVLRKQAARTKEVFQKAISKAFHSIQRLDLKHWFLNIAALNSNNYENAVNLTKLIFSG